MALVQNITNASAKRCKSLIWLEAIFGNQLKSDFLHQSRIRLPIGRVGTSPHELINRIRQFLNSLLSAD